MATFNETMVTQFILIGLSEHPKARAVFFWFLLVLYLVCVLGNGVIVLLILVDSRLHTPMYFFLCVLSFVDLTLINNTVPETLANCFIDMPMISFTRCLSQMYLGLLLVSTECFVLAIMAYDRFVAICHPLHYIQIMNWPVCIGLVGASVSLAFLLTLINALLQPTDFCGQHVINHFVCELQSFLRLDCSESRTSELFLHISSLFVLLPPFGFIVLTYGRIGLAVHRMRSAQGRRKAFSTCSSHLAVVSVFYGTIMIMYLRPQEKSVSDQSKIISVAYGGLTPMLNPVIYSLRNRDVKGAFWKLVGRKTLD
uniref:Olfactory receptor n=1 Tax=Pogona vitticeps TaxID=103695 RepID=A0A6J0SH75_9SAUR